MIDLSKRYHTSTGVHMLQKSGDKFKFRCGVDTLKRFTSVAVKAEYLGLFNSRADGVYHSELFDDIETGKVELCKFIEKVCGVRCKV